MWFIILSGLVFTFLFWFFPNLDIWFSSLFYSDTMGFVYKEHPIAIAIYNFVPIFTTTLLLLLIINLFGRFLQSHTKIICNDRKLLSYRKVIYLFLVLSLGPGLLVHQGFKEFFERPRPKHIVEFGGTEEYALPFEIRRNSPGKSFVSGHAAMGFYVATIAFLLKGRKRNIVYNGGIFCGLVVGIGRIAQGKHFMSDILFSGILTLLVAHIIFYLMFATKQKSN